MIIVVDPRSAVANAYKSTISREGYAVTAFAPAEFAAWFHSASDTELDAVEGVVLGDCAVAENAARMIKRKGSIPAIVLSDVKVLESTLRRFAAGVDDVVRKPVHARELVARFGIIRRRLRGAAPALWQSDGLAVFGDGREATACGAPLRLPRRERRILEYLAASHGRRVTRAQIFNAIYGLQDDETEECVVESHVSKLRKKLRAGLGYDPIDSQRFLGYQLVAREALAA